MPARGTPKLAERPRRGTPKETRERLLAAGAEVFNRDGYAGTDSNRIAREAGYAPGTFYKHFPDKRALFLAVYAEWVESEWRDIGGVLAAGGAVREVASRIVEGLLAHHRRWHGFRASLRALVSSDAAIRDHYREQRRRQLAWMEALGARSGRGRTREENAALLFTLERLADALADGEAEALELGRDDVVCLMVDRVSLHIGP